MISKTLLSHIIASKDPISCEDLANKVGINIIIVKAALKGLRDDKKIKLVSQTKGPYLRGVFSGGDPFDRVQWFEKA